MVCSSHSQLALASNLHIQRTGRGSGSLHSVRPPVVIRRRITTANRPALCKFCTLKGLAPDGAVGHSSSPGFAIPSSCTASAVRYHAARGYPRPGFVPLRGQPLHHSRRVQAETRFTRHEAASNWRSTESTLTQRLHLVICVAAIGDKSFSEPRLVFPLPSEYGQAHQTAAG